MIDITPAVPGYDDKADMHKAVETAATWVKTTLEGHNEKIEKLIEQVDPQVIQRNAVAMAYAAAWTQGA